jgi:cytochrome c peroxidase
MVQISFARLAGAVFVLMALASCSDKQAQQLPPNAAAPDVAGPRISQGNTPGEPANEKNQDPPEVAVGQRLFRETRFNQYFYSHSRGRMNADPAAGDPVLEILPTLTSSFKNPYAGQGMNCASCHFVDELQGQAGLGNRAYNDFARRSPIPDRGDGHATTLRNSPPFVNSTLALEAEYKDHPLFLHFDGEFATPEDLVRGGFTGRNFGWLADEAPLAVAHLAQVIREDDGQGRLARDYGGAYARVLKGTDASVPEKFKLPAEYRLDVTTATDQQIFDGVAKLVGAYLRSIVYSRNPRTREFDGSPYDVFLEKNELPRKPSGGESDLEYARRLLKMIEQLPPERIRYVVDGSDGKFALHAQAFAFGPQELEGLKIFLREPLPHAVSARGAHAGNCASCHAPPSFTDFAFHNTGVAQEEYDAIHGSGSFARLKIPAFAERIGREDSFFGPTAAHPRAQGIFASVPSADHPGLTDLGVWNSFGNPANPKAQPSLKKLLCEQVAKRSAVAAPCDNEAALSAAVASFKTATVRNLGQSAPYLHTGRKDTLEDVLGFYLQLGSLARVGRVRAADPELARVALAPGDIAPVAAFLRALNEDYH